jgi:hypothetical protein
MAVSTAVAVFTYATYENVQAQKEAQSLNERAAATQQQQYKEEAKKAEIQNLRSVREQIRASRIAQSSMVNQAALSGGTGGSAVAGGVASAGSQLSGNLNYMGQIAEQNTKIGSLAAEAAGYQAAAASASADAAIWGTIGQAAVSGYKLSK